MNKILRINSSSYSFFFFLVVVIFKKSIRKIRKNILYSEKHIEGHFFEIQKKIMEGGSLEQGIMFAQLFAVKHVLDFQIFLILIEKKK